jgi:hypothetical protein
MNINEIVEALNAGASADIWYDPQDASDVQDAAAIQRIELTQNAMTEAANLLSAVQAGNYEVTADALGHWAVCKAGAGDVIADLMTEDVANMICAALNVDKSGDETTEPAIPEGSFHVQVGRDATAYFGAIIPSDSLEEAKGNLSKYGYECDISTVWTESGSYPFDNVEVCEIASPDGTIVRWTEQSGWEEEES